jgi:uncharacterized repeat protein (TIGR03806 family)
MKYLRTYGCPVKQDFGLRLSFVCLLLLTAWLTACGGGSGGKSSEDSASSQRSGLQERPANSLCHAKNFGLQIHRNDGLQTTAIKLTQVFSALNVSSPVLLLPHPTLAGIFYVVQQRGKVYRVDSANGTSTELTDLADFYDLSLCGECGLLSMAFHPDFANNGLIYFSFTENVGNQMLSAVARFETPDNGATLSLNPNGSLQRFDIISVVQPFANHNGGHIGFGPDGLLYFGLGDGGSGNDPLNNAQDLSSLPGSMLRLNDDGSPAAGNNVDGALPEIYAYGLRNPWRWSFDRETGELWVGDVGQNSYEEVDIITAGSNYGWRCREGLHNTSNNCTSQGPFTDPLTEYDHTEGQSITGGYVYRGVKLPGLVGKYLFADFGSGTVWTLTAAANGTYTREILLDTGLNIASFGEDLAGELYLVSFSGIYRIDPEADKEAAPEVPPSLSATGCADPDHPAEPVAGLLPYSLNEPFWSDGAEKTRYMAVPDGQRIAIAEDGDFLFPTGTVLRKDFHFGGRFIETRFFVKQQASHWQGFSYQWNEAQTDALLVAGGLDADIMGAANQLQRWRYPGSSECLLCHTSAAGYSLGLETSQLNRDMDYPSTGKRANQLVTLNSIGMFDGFSAALLELRIPSSQAAEVVLEGRARSYLHSNCASCHRPEGTTQSAMDLRFTTSLAATATCDEEPANGDLGIASAKLLAPQDPERSLLLQRMLRTDSAAMPPLSHNKVDVAGTQLIADWIDSVSSCTD